jgi:ABC-type polysaccharide/polyol phosphate export permease
METSNIYDSSKRRNPAIEEILNAFQYRDLIKHLVRRDITTRYKRSVLGIAWTMLNPLGTMIIMTLVFSNLFNRKEFFSVYLLSGLLIWNFFAQTSQHIIKDLIWGEDLFQRIYLPRSSFAIAAIGTGMVNLTLALVPLILVKLVIGSPITWQIVFFPVCFIYIACFSLGVGLVIASLALHFHDIAEMYSVILTGWFYLTPIIYPFETLPKTIQKVLLLNPMVHMVQLMRSSFYSNVTPTLNEFLLSGAIAIATLCLGWLLFSGQAEEFVMKV